MYTADEKKNAIQKYIDNNYNATKTVRELGYPSVPGLLKWYNAYYPPKSEKTVKPKKERRVYTPEEKQHAIDLYFKNGCNLKKTVRELGYGSQTGVLRWLRDTVPDKVSKPVPREWRGDYSEETKQSAVLELCSNELTPNELCQKYGISRTTLYEWKIQYIGKGKSALNEDKKTKKSDYIKQIEEEEHLEVRITKRKRYSSYMGEISPAVANKINRDFHSSKPNEKWLTDITEFNIGEKKVYLSPIIDCFDGLPVTWTIGTSPNAELVNTMLDNAIAQLDDGEKPIVHSDRGCHYRWPGWGCGEA